MTIKAWRNHDLILNLETLYCSADYDSLAYYMYVRVLMMLGMSNINTILLHMYINSINTQFDITYYLLTKRMRLVLPIATKVHTYN